MSFPSQALSEWTQNIRNLWNNAHRTKHGEPPADYGWCQCDIRHAILCAPQNQQAQLVSAIFWSVWIDQVLFTVTRHTNYNDYLSFRGKYPFPKLYSHFGIGHAPPYVLLTVEADEGKYQIPTLELLKEDKNEFWIEVKQYLLSINKNDIVLQAEKEFANDLNERSFPEICRKLWE